MKREIKFRAKIKAKDFRVKLAMAGKPKNEGEWTYGEFHLQSTIPHIHEGMDKYPIDVDTVGQFTGLKDKNGKEIYEGDIVKNMNNKNGYITFLMQEMGYVIVWSNSDTRLGHRSRGSGYDLDMTLEVIGNIYDNPELLKGGEE